MVYGQIGRQPHGFPGVFKESLAERLAVFVERRIRFPGTRRFDSHFQTFRQG
jgi:hypothetical protein